MIEQMLIPDEVMLWIYIFGAGLYASGAVVFFAYRAVEGGSRNHIMMALALAFLSLHHAVLAVRNFRYWLSITETVALTRLATLLMLACSALGFASHLRYRWRVRNE